MNERVMTLRGLGSHYRSGYEGHATLGRTGRIADRNPPGAAPTAYNDDEGYQPLVARSVAPGAVRRLRDIKRPLAGASALGAAQGINPSGCEIASVPSYGPGPLPFDEGSQYDGIGWNPNAHPAARITRPFWSFGRAYGPGTQPGSLGVSLSPAAAIPNSTPSYTMLAPQQRTLVTAPTQITTVPGTGVRVESAPPVAVYPTPVTLYSASSKQQATPPSTDTAVAAAAAVAAADAAVAAAAEVERQRQEAQAALIRADQERTAAAEAAAKAANDAVRAAEEQSDAMERYRDEQERIYRAMATQANADRVGGDVSNAAFVLLDEEDTVVESSTAIEDVSDAVEEMYQETTQTAVGGGIPGWIVPVGAAVIIGWVIFRG